MSGFDDSLEELLKCEDAAGIQPLPDRDYRPGDRVRVAEGLMEGYEGIFQCRTGRERVVLLLEIAKKTVMVQLESHQIEPLQD